VKESGTAVDQAKGVTFVKYESGKAVYALAAGAYQFTARQ